MNESTRNAARKILGWHIMKHDQPALFAWAGPLPESTRNAIKITEGFVFGTFSHCTIVEGSYLDAAKGPVPFQPFHYPGGIAAGVRQIDAMVDLIGNRPVLAEVGYTEGAGTDLVTVGKWKAAGAPKIPIYSLLVNEKRIPGGRAFDHSGTEAKLDKDFVVALMGEDSHREVIHFWTEVTGQLMRHHAGVLEYRGPDIPLLLRSSCGSMVSIIRAAPAPDVFVEKTELELFEDQRLPGLWTENLQRSLATDQEKEEAKTSKKEKKTRGGKRR